MTTVICAGRSATGGSSAEIVYANPCWITLWTVPDSNASSGTELIGAWSAKSTGDHGAGATGRIQTCSSD